MELVSTTEKQLQACRDAPISTRLPVRLESTLHIAANLTVDADTLAVMRRAIVLKNGAPDFDAGAVARPKFLDHLRRMRKNTMLPRFRNKSCIVHNRVYSPFDRSLMRPTLLTLREYGLGFCVLTKGGTRALRIYDLHRPDRDAFVRHSLA